jgi:hypothetical protein
MSQEDDESKNVLDFAGELSKYSLLLRGGENINSVETLYSAYWSLLLIFQAVLGDPKLAPTVLKGEALHKFLALTKSTRKPKKPVKTQLSHSCFTTLPPRVQNLLKALIHLNTLQSQKESSITLSMSKFYYSAAAQASRCIIQEIEALKNAQEQLKNRGSHLYTEAVTKLLGDKFAYFSLQTSAFFHECYERGLSIPNISHSAGIEEIIKYLVEIKSQLERLSSSYTRTELPDAIGKIEYDVNTESALNLRLASHALHSTLEKQQDSISDARELASNLKIGKVIKQEMGAKLGHVESLQSEYEHSVTPLTSSINSVDSNYPALLKKITSLVDEGHALLIETDKIRDTVDRQMDKEFKQRSEASKLHCFSSTAELLKKLRLLLEHSLLEHKRISSESAHTQKIIAAELKQTFEESSKYVSNEMKNSALICIAEIEEAAKNGRMERDMMNFGEHKQELNPKMLKEYFKDCRVLESVADVNI